MADPFATDEDLLGYALIHSQTDRALFHREHVKRIWTLAGRAVPNDLPDFVSVYYDTMSTVVEEARKRKKESAGV